MAKDQTQDLLKFLQPFGEGITDLVMWLRDFAWDLCPLTNDVYFTRCKLVNWVYQRIGS